MNKENKRQTVSNGGNRKRRTQSVSGYSGQTKRQSSVSGVKKVQAKRNISGKRGKKKKSGVGKKIGSTLLVILIIAALGAGGYFAYQHWYQGKSVVEEYVQKGVQLLQEENYEEAIGQFEKAIASEETQQDKDDSMSVTEKGTPYITEAYRGLGMVYFAQQDYENARMNLQQVIDLGGEETPILYNLMGLSAMYLEDYDGALSAFEAGAALPETGTYTDESNTEQSVDYAAVIQEMKFNRIICFEKKLDWANAKLEMEAYTAAYPGDTSVQKEAEFLSTK